MSGKSQGQFGIKAVPKWRLWLQLRLNRSCQSAYSSTLAEISKVNKQTLREKGYNKDLPKSEKGKILSNFSDFPAIPELVHQLVHLSMFQMKYIRVLFNIWVKAHNLCDKSVSSSIILLQLRWPFESKFSQVCYFMHMLRDWSLTATKGVQCFQSH